MESHSLLHIVGFRWGATIKQSEMLGQALRKPTWSRAKHVAPPFALPFADDMANYYCCMTVFHLGLKRLLRSLWRADQETKCSSFLPFFFILLGAGQHVKIGKWFRLHAALLLLAWTTQCDWLASGHLLICSSASEMTGSCAELAPALWAQS